ncbi:MAG TPA: (deoxy)nucleoside triphosphate pyrophosphohydrolase [Pirellulaceae bacterium]|jgi:mutator protein MutT|nr:(deoxy)nucleoside triphosphate pyrophosphohydrolase [Pirellulaceae bacterium]
MCEEPTLIAIAVVEHNGRFLVGMRPAETVLAGFSEFPGGKVEPNEVPAQAAVRECLEETGLEVEVSGAFPDQVHQYHHGQVRLLFFHCRLKQPGGRPNAPFQWVERAELQSLRFPTGNNSLLALLQDAS